MASRASLADSLTRGAVFIERLKAGEVKKFDPFLREIDRLIRERLAREDLTTFNRSRLEALLREIDGLIAGVQVRYTRLLELDLHQFAEYQSEFAATALNKATPASVMVTTPTPELLLAAIKARPLQVTGAAGGKLLEPFIADWSKADREAVTGAIRLGVAQGQTTQEVVTRIRGTRAAQYEDGLLAVSKRHAEAVVRTAVQHVGDVARNETYGANADIVKGEQWISTLDSRTTEICMSLDGTQWPLGEGPRPPAHINCRSVRAPVLAKEFEFLTKDEIRASVNGPVDAGLTFFDWLKQQPASFQDEALGPRRGQLFRDGGLSAERFSQLQLGRNFEPMTLAEMKAREPLAFERAGL